jgi:hypothetical protein
VSWSESVTPNEGDPEGFPPVTSEIDLGDEILEVDANEAAPEPRPRVVPPHVEMSEPVMPPAEQPQLETKAEDRTAPRASTAGSVENRPPVAPPEAPGDTPASKPEAAPDAEAAAEHREESQDTPEIAMFVTASTEMSDAAAGKAIREQGIKVVALEDPETAYVDHGTREEREHLYNFIASADGWQQMNESQRAERAEWKTPTEQVKKAFQLFEDSGERTAFLAELVGTDTKISLLGVPEDSPEHAEVEGAIALGELAASAIEQTQPNHVILNLKMDEAYQQAHANRVRQAAVAAQVADLKQQYADQRIAVVSSMGYSTPLEEKLSETAPTESTYVDRRGQPGAKKQTYFDQAVSLLQQGSLPDNELQSRVALEAQMIFAVDGRKADIWALSYDPTDFIRSQDLTIVRTLLEKLETIKKLNTGNIDLRQIGVSAEIMNMLRWGTVKHFRRPNEQ